MSPETGFILMEEVVPRLRVMIPRIKPVGAEDAEELLQDALVVAAKMMHDLEKRNKQVTPGNIVYYTTLHMKSGRRSYSAGRVDVMGSGTQLDGKSCVHSLEEPAAMDPDTLEEIPLGDLLAGRDEDPSMAASRKVDWDDFLESHNPRYAGLVSDIASGKPAVDRARRDGKPLHSVYKLKEKLAEDVREYFGEQAIEDSLHQPNWRGGLNADKERFACQAERRRW